MYRDKKPFSCKLFTLLPLLCGLAVFCFAQQTRADDYFNPAPLDIDNPRQEKTDLSVYEKGPGQAPGKYQVSIFIDNNKVDTRDVTFKLQKDVKGNRSLPALFQPG